MKKISFCLIFGLIPLLSFDTPPLVRTKVADGITALLPKNFRPMDDVDLVQRYPSVRQPIAAYTNYERSVDFSVNISASQWPDHDTNIAKDFFKASIQNMFDNVDMIDEGVNDLDHKKFIFFEFEYKISGNTKTLGQEEPILNYTYIEYLIGSHHTIVFSFNCPHHLRPEWQDTAHKMMKSIRIKE